MSRISQSFQRGFAAAKQERINEWPEVRARGFWNPMRVEVVSAIFIIISGHFAAWISPDLAPYLLDLLLVGLIITAIIVISEKLHWNRREKEWRQHQETAHGSAADSTDPPASL